jgi:hypothetical protein
VTSSDGVLTGLDLDVELSGSVGVSAGTPGETGRQTCAGDRQKRPAVHIREE